MKTLKCVLFLLIIALCPPQVYAQDRPAPQNEKIFNAESFVLENGLQVIVIPNHRAPVVTHMVWYKVGAADEDWGKSGIAHFLEHLMFKGSEGLKPGEFSEIVRGLGGNDNAFTNQDYTAYFQSVAVESLETVMTMEAGRMRGLALPPEEVDSERMVILEERRQRIDNDPRAKFSEQVSAVMFVNHPYGIPVIGWLHEMEKLTRDDARAFYDRWYGPNNAILVVSGDVTGQQVLGLAQKIYGPLPRVPVPERIRPSSPPMNSLTHVTLEHPAIHQPLVQIARRVPSYRQNKEDSLVLQVIDEIMGGGPTARLYRALAVDQKIATGADFSYDSDSWDDSTVWIMATPVPGAEMEDVENALRAELRKLVATGVTAQELSDAKSRMQDQAIYARDSLSGPAMIFGQALVTGSTIDDVEYWPQSIAKVTAEQIHDVAKKYLDLDNFGVNPPVTGYLLPQKKVENIPEGPPQEAQP